MNYLNLDNLKASLARFSDGKPFNHCVIDSFFDLDVARQLDAEFPPYDSERWFYYKNAIEDKKTANDWNLFPALTYKVFRDLVSEKFANFLAKEMDIELFPDQGLHGGGWHIHAAGGNLNPHLDYSIHPKVGLQRKLNIIIYLSEALKPEHGGHLGLWSHDEEFCQPLKLVAEVEPKFNRAILFDTTQNSWHGMSRTLETPENVFRKSFAVYYLTTPPANVDQRERAMFAPREAQKGDQDIADLIKQRSNPKDYYKAYRKS